jgi:5-methylcytosine-specific restriction endonuclease McrA
VTLRDIWPISALDEPTLVLNRFWTAVNVVPVRRALVLVCRDAARIISPENFETHDFHSWLGLSPEREAATIRLVTRSMRVPEVIVLRHSERPAQAHVAFTRRNLYRRDFNTCQYCGRRPGVEKLSIDHVVPRSQGGITSWTNCVLACLACNLEKGNRTPERAGMKLLRAPQRPRWVPYEALTGGVRKESWPRFIGQASSTPDARRNGIADVTDPKIEVDTQ